MTLRRTLTLACLLAIIPLVVGCSSQKKITTEYAQANVAPEMSGIARTQGERDNMRVYTDSIRSRGLADDWDAIWFIDRPSTLSRYPIPFH